MDELKELEVLRHELIQGMQERLRKNISPDR